MNLAPILLQTTKSTIHRVDVWFPFIKTFALSVKTIIKKEIRALFQLNASQNINRLTKHPNGTQEQIPREPYKGNAIKCDIYFTKIPQISTSISLCECEYNYWQYLFHNV